jgi:hypothetical protein
MRKRKEKNIRHAVYYIISLFSSNLNMRRSTLKLGFRIVNMEESTYVMNDALMLSAVMDNTFGVATNYRVYD